MNWLKAIPFLLAIAGTLWGIVMSMRAKKLKASNTLMKQRLKQLSTNLYQLKTGFAKDSHAKDSIAEMNKRIKGARNNEDAEAIRRDIVDGILGGLQDYHASTTDPSR